MKILIVEDDNNIAELLRLYLEKDGFTVAIAENGAIGVAEFERFLPDLVLLDIMLPVLDGWGVCKEIRAISNVPIIMLTAKGDTLDKVTGLEMGADDYVVKPFEIGELIARVHAVMRRFEITGGGSKRLVYDNLVIDMDSFELLVCDKRVEAPPKEMELLFHLASSPNKVYTRNQLLDEVWGFDYFGDSRTVDVHVKRLREKIENVSDKWTLKTVWGVGYKFEVPEVRQHKGVGAE
jgi:DNA-binding response OmpR family regulator